LELTLPLASRLAAGAGLAFIAFVPSGCGWNDRGCTDTYAERGAAAEVVQVERTYAVIDVTAEITGWVVEPHPQSPGEGNLVHYSTRFVDTREGDTSTVGLDVCAVDEERIALACSQVYMHDEWVEPDGTFTWDDWIAVDNPEIVDAVLLVPNDQAESRKTCEQDPMYGGGVHKPTSPLPGDQL
jgi:hypothetical protein